MKNYFKTIGALLTATPLVTTISCSNEMQEKKPSEIELRDFLIVNINGVPLSKQEKEIVAYKLEKPVGANAISGLGYAYFQMRCGLIGHVKFNLIDAFTDNGQIIHFGSSWASAAIDSLDYSLTNTHKYNARIHNYFPWAMSIESAKTAYKKIIYPYKLTYSQIWTDISTI